MSIPAISRFRCAHCGCTEKLKTVTFPRPKGWMGECSLVLCEEHVEEFWVRVGEAANEFAAHPVICRGVELILQGLHELYGLDLEQEDLKTTPERVARMFAELSVGLSQNPEDFLKTQFPSPKPPNLIVTRRIDFNSLCIHHLAIMTGYAYVGYIPEERIVGLSKLGRVVESYARQPQLQERMTNQIADCIDKVLKPRGVIVVVSARHDCMCTRGILKKGAVTEVSAVRGIFLENVAGCKDEFFELIKIRNENGC